MPQAHPDEWAGALVERTASLPPPWPHDPLGETRARVVDSGERLVAFDDDPTGSQTVHDVPLLTDWDDSLVEQALADAPLCFVLSNTRSLNEDEAVVRLRVAARNVGEVARRLGRTLRVLSRSDSTLRGHFPAELEAIDFGLGEQADAILLAPAFIQGGRVTVDDVHWVRRGDDFTPVAATEFAADPTFAFSSSHLPTWVEEKTRGRVPASEVHSLDLALIREGGPDAVAAGLSDLGGGRIVVANALVERDVEVIAAGAQRAELDGRTIRHRCGASMVRARAGLAQRPHLSAADLGSIDGPGLIVCGSHVPMSTAQLEVLFKRDDTEGIEIDVPALLSAPELNEGLASEAAGRIDEVLRAGRHAVLSTSRALAAGGRSPLEVARLVSGTVVSAVRYVRTPPGFVLGKGGITSHDLATRALGIRRAEVLGQVAAGVSVWRAAQGRLPGVPFVVFPGNVGEERTLAEVVEKLSPTA